MLVVIQLVSVVHPQLDVCIAEQLVYFLNMGDENYDEGVAETSEQLTAGAFIQYAWETFKKRPWFLVGMEACVMAVAFFSSFVTNFVTLFLHLPMTGVVGGLIQLVVFLINYTIQIIFTIGILTVAIKAHESVETVRFSDIWNPEPFWRYLATCLLSFLIILVGFLFFIVPGIIASVAFVFAPFLTIDKGLGPIEALKESARITKGNRWHVFALSVAYLFMMLLGLMAFIVGFLAAAMIFRIALVHAYRGFNKAVDANVPPKPLVRSEKLTLWGAVAFYVLFMALVITIVVFIMSQKQNNSQADSVPSTPGFLVYPTEQPANSLAPLNATRLPFTGFTITNNTDIPTKVNGIEVQASKLTDEAGIKEVELVDSDGNQMGVAKPLDAKNKAIIGGSFTVPAGATESFYVAANIASCEHACPDETQTVSIDVDNINVSTTVVGNLPIVGAIQTMNSELKIGTITSNLLGVSDRQISKTTATDITFAKLRFTGGSGEDAKLYIVRFKYVGTADYNKLSNMQVTADGTDSLVGWTTEDGNTYATAVFKGGVLLPAGKSIDVSLHGDVAGDVTEGSAIQFDIDDVSGIYFVGQTYGYGIEPSASTSTSDSSGVFVSGGTPWFRGATFTYTDN